MHDCQFAERPPGYTAGGPGVPPPAITTRTLRAGSVSYTTRSINTTGGGNVQRLKGNRVPGRIHLSTRPRGIARRLRRRQYRRWKTVSLPYWDKDRNGMVNRCRRRHRPLSEGGRRLTLHATPFPQTLKRHKAPSKAATRTILHQYYPPPSMHNTTPRLTPKRAQLFKQFCYPPTR